MSGLLTLGIILSATDALSPVLGTATDHLNRLGSRISSVSANLTKLGTASLALGTAITAPLKGALDDYQNLATAQGEIASLGIDDSGIKSITKSAREFSSEFAGTTAPEFIKASYDIKSGISSLSDTAVGEFTKTAAMTAAATKSSTGEMTALFATGFGIYRKQFENFGASTVDGWNNLSAEEKDIKFGEYFSAGIAGSVQAFKTDGANMSSALGTLGASATSAGVSFAEQLSVLGQLQATMSGSEAATKYKAFIGSAQSAGNNLGLSFTDANNKLLSMPDIIGKIKEKYGNTIDALESADLKKAFGTEEAVALVKLMYNETDTLTQNINKMGTSLENGTQKTRAMAKATNKGKEFQLLGQQMEGVSSLIGGAFAPLALSLSETIGGVVKSVSSWMQENEGLSSTIFTGIAVVGGLLTVLGSVGVAVGAVGMAMPFLAEGLVMVTGAFGTLGTVMSTVGRIFLMNPIGLAVTAIAGAAYLIYSNWEQISNFFLELWNGVSAIFSSGLQFIQDYLGWTPLGMIINNWTPITHFFSELWGEVASIFSGGWSSLTTELSSVAGYLKSPFEPFFDWIGSKFEWITNTIGTVLHAVDSVTDVAGDALDSASSVVGDIGSSISDGFKSASSFFTMDGGYGKEKPKKLTNGEITNIQNAFAPAVSTKGSKQSIEKTQKDVLSSNVSSTNQYMYKHNQSTTAQSKVIHHEPTYHITVNNPSSDVDVIRAVKEHEKRQRNKSYEDD